jgi:hypothetical protein
MSVRETCISIMSEIYINEVREEMKGKNNAFDVSTEMRVVEEESDSEEFTSSINTKDRSFSIICDHIHDRNSYVQLKCFRR